MEVIFAIVIGTLIACGVYLILRARTFAVVLGLTLISYAVNVFLFITGRAKDIIIRGGENIACGEIEHALYEHDAVAEASVYGAPDDRLGEIVCTTVYLKPGENASDAEIQSHVRERLAAFKVPSHVLFSDEPLPRIASGKFDKRAMQRSAIEQLQGA